MDRKADTKTGKEAKVELKSVDLKQAGIAAAAKFFNKA
jgi:hypothetical protein